VRPLPLDVLYANIGRGHPFYLDGTCEALARAQAPVELAIHSVFDTTWGPGRWLWLAARGAYHAAGRGGGAAQFYSRLRQARHPERRTLADLLLRRSLHRYACQDDGAKRPVLTAHPIIVQALRGHRPIIYQHGEHVVPDEAIVPGAELVLVPTQQVAARFQSCYQPEQIVVTGSCLDPKLVPIAAKAYAQRRARLLGNQPLTVGLFSSGAEPEPHVAQLRRSAMALQRRGISCHALAVRGGRLERALGPVMTNARQLHRYGNRRDINVATEAFWGELDLIVAPPHERSNWALAAGLPMLMVSPTIGSFAPLNRQLLLESGTGLDLGELQRGLSHRQLQPLGTLGELQQPLAAMSATGWQPRALDGFSRSAAAICDYLSRY
jgi:hypothetical protein